MLWELLTAIGGGYLLGSIPFGLILARHGGMGDIRQQGSGNIGATNVLRGGGRGLALATLILDGSKGALAVTLIAQYLTPPLALIAALAAFIGHVFPLWLGFKGGKGVATYIGILLAASPMGAFCFTATWLAMAYAFRISSLAALAACAITPLWLAAHGQLPIAALSFVLSLLVFWTHRANITRLMGGEEPRIGAGQSQKTIRSAPMSKTPPALNAEQLAALRLARTDHVGPITYQQLMAHYGSAQAALDALPELSKRGGRKRPLRAYAKSRAEQEAETTRNLGGAYIIWGDAHYPPQLAAIADPPPVLSAFGHTSLLARPAVAFVGARNASASAMRITENLAGGVATRDIAVVSGLARGVDACAHKAALTNGTIAVIANGFDIAYPKENTDLQAAIAESGLVLCENPPGTPPQAALFPRRNRIVSGLSLGVVVVEAALKSGSLITAKCAGEQGREVMAVPGSPLDARCLGSNGLIQNGAALVGNTDDVMRVITPLIDNQRFSAPPPDYVVPPLAEQDVTDSERRAISALLGPVPISIDELAARSELPVPIIYRVLLELELAGRLIREPARGVSLLPD